MSRPPKAPARAQAFRPDLILASASPRRAELLRELGHPFTILTSAAEEVDPVFLSPAETAMVNASRKAMAVARRHPDRLVLGADTVVSLGGTHFGKPSSLDEAEAMLRQLQGRVHQVATGICLVRWNQRRRRLAAETTAVAFRRLSTRAIREYLQSTRPLDKAGGYGIQDRGERIVSEIKGSYSNVVGLPLELLKVVLAEFLSFG